MTRPRKSRATTAEGRFLASRIQDAHRRGATNAEIGRAFGINERTVRKIRSGETSGRRTFAQLVEPSLRAQGGPNPSIVRVDIKIGEDAGGNDIIRTVNARIPTVVTRDGRRISATPADVFRIPGLATLIDAEGKRLATQYAASMDRPGKGARVQSFRPISQRRRPLRIEVTGYTVS